jgi:hypothetical protein
VAPVRYTSLQDRSAVKAALKEGGIPAVMALASGCSRSTAKHWAQFHGFTNLGWASYQERRLPASVIAQRVCALELIRCFKCASAALRTTPENLVNFVRRHPHLISEEARAQISRKRGGRAHGMFSVAGKTARVFGQA